MIRILLSGSHGRMGLVLQKMIAEQPDMTVVAGIDRSGHSADFPVYTSLAEVKEVADVVIDFSNADYIPELLNDCVNEELPAVIATTGLSAETKMMLPVAAQLIPVFYSANMSIGVNVLMKALQAITPSLESDFDIEIVEKHHNQKRDAPSGTALLLADAINEKCTQPKDYVNGRSGKDAKRHKNELGIHALRGGTIPGEHTVLFAGADELIELKHTALSREIFANGALKAARFLTQQPAGLYNMSDLLNTQSGGNHD